ncbi:T9SS type A sorting domain-containing protein [Salibacter halophilus]|uniref:T9SS type A sorting domain-containing protein n=1 Tax=Salibacter halophilus TaxID=1803916 RepID=UPI001478C23F|nr:T9SS type A sorting domain-containing protein [Salibacter halophilus]
MQSQCNADAGNDTIICGTSSQSLVLGGDVVAQGGTPPYTYKWEAEEYLLNEKKTASFFLDDTTKANPEFVEVWDKSVSFKLTVTDSLGNSCSDSVKVIFCAYSFNYNTTHHFISPGDTVDIGPATSPYLDNPDCGSFMFTGWTPDYAISDPMSLSPKVWPDSSVTYQGTFEDTIGCYTVFSNTSHSVKVISTGIEESIETEDDVKIKPNPFSISTTFTFYDQGAKKLNVYNSAGKRVRNEEIKSNIAVFNRMGLKAGVYFFRVFDMNSSEVHSGKFVIMN